MLDNMSGNKAHYLPLDGCADSDESLVLTAQKSKGRNWKWFLVVLLSNGLTFFSSITWSSFYNSCPYPPSTMVESVQDVGDEVEKSWADLGIYEAPIVIPAAQVSDYGIEKTGHVWLDPKDNPAAPYAGMSVKVQVLHYLHCVNYLRQGLWYNVDYYRARGHPMWDESQHILTGPQSVPLVELHTAHCIDLLRQAELDDRSSFCDYGDGLLSVHIYTNTEMKMKGLETVRVVARKREQADHQTNAEVGPRKSLTNRPSWIDAAVGMLKFIFTTVQEYELRITFMLRNGYISTDLHNDMMMYRYSYMTMYGCHDLVVDMLTIMDTITLVHTRTGGAGNLRRETSMLIVSNEIYYNKPFTNEYETPLKAIEWT
ncbi:hypothetical protein CBER1_10916 [Cercospora berteroae]|uniref:Uncharacterized protein n=1 Tax=Cercospora berteroae TaxID=357750 RepID=A0A2S6BY32_9PEZI|nr:hypothetical protein CBER1_10916 [Cercospora berteroae]